MWKMPQKPYYHRKKKLNAYVGGKWALTKLWNLNIDQFYPGDLVTATGGKTKNTCIAEPCELGEVARKMLGMGGRDKDRVENWTIISGIQFMMLWAPGEYKERQEIVGYNPSRANFWQ